MNEEETAKGGELSGSWCLLNPEEAGAAAEAAAASPASPASSSDHSDFEIFDEDEGASPPLLPTPEAGAEAGLEPPASAAAPLSDAEAELEDMTRAIAEVPRPLPILERRAQERRLLLALRSLRGDVANGSTTPSPMEAPANAQEGRVISRQEPPRVQIIQHSAEEESLPESDIQIEDSQNVGAGPDSIEELMEGDRVRRYQHSPNAHLNARLNGLVMCAVLFVLGLAMGHFLGSTHERFSNHFERVDRNDRLKSIQTELLQCARKYDELELQLNEVKATLVQKEYVDKWESLYQEGEEEKAALTATMNLYKSRYNTQKQLLTQCELKFQELEEKVGQDKVRNLRCQPCPAVDLSCPRELQALKASMRALLQLPLPNSLACDLTSILPSWPALRTFVSARLQNATALLMEALPSSARSAQVKQWLSDWSKLQADLMRTPRMVWSKLTRDKGRTVVYKTQKEPSDDSKQQQQEEKEKEAKVDDGVGGQNDTVTPSAETQANPEQLQVNWFLRRRSETEDKAADKPPDADGYWFWRRRKPSATKAKEEEEEEQPQALNGFWYWRRKGKKLPSLSTEDLRWPPAKKGTNTKEPPATTTTNSKDPPAMKATDTKEPPATKATDTKEPPATSSEEPPAMNGDDVSPPGDFDEEAEPSDWLDAFMQLRAQMMRAQMRIWRSLKQMATRKGRANRSKSKQKKKKKRKQESRQRRQKSPKWIYE